MDEQEDNRMDEQQNNLTEAGNQNIAMDTDMVSENAESLKSSWRTFASEEKSGEERHVFSVVHSLAEEVDLIENEIEPLVQGESEDVDDYFLDVINVEDDDDSYKGTIEENDHLSRNEEDDEETLSPKSFSSPQDAINSEGFRRPIMLINCYTNSMLIQKCFILRYL